MYVDLMLNLKAIDTSRESIEAIVAKVEALGYVDFHDGNIPTVLENNDHYWRYLCLEVKGYDRAGEICLATGTGRDDIVVESLEDFYEVAEKYAKGA